jgi:transmembrane sensor
MERKFANYFQGKLSRAERTELLKSIEEDEVLKNEFLNMQNVHAIMSLSSEEEDSEEGIISYHNFLKKRNRIKNRGLAMRFLKCAAIIAVVISMSLFVALNVSKPLGQAITENTLFVPAGQRAVIKLQDGTEVWLNAQTTLIYPSQFVGSERRVYISGEGFFTVAKNEKMPFIVSTDQADIKVLGTTFNVNSYPDTDFTQTSLLEGSVEICRLGDEKATITLKPNQQAILKDNEVRVDEIPFHNHFLWKEGIYCFNNEPISAILKKLEVYFNVKIIVENNCLSDAMITGKFRQTDGIDEILRILKKTKDFKIEKNADGNVITIK